MRNSIIFLCLWAVVIVFVIRHKHSVPKQELVVDSYFRELRIPIWVPFSRGYEPGSDKNPAYLNLRQERHFFMVVSVPASCMLELYGENGERTGPRRFPEFELINESGSAMKPLDTVAWPRAGAADSKPDFADDSDWYPKPGDNPNKRYRIGLYWRMNVNMTLDNFQLQMDNNPPIDVPKAKYNQLHSWHGLF